MSLAARIWPVPELGTPGEGGVKSRAGWGRLPATARINDSKWKTAIWFDSKLNTYLLPLKEEIRKAEQVAAGKTITVSIYI